jgi:hypothetical protein
MLFLQTNKNLKNVFLNKTKDLPCLLIKGKVLELGPVWTEAASYHAKNLALTTSIDKRLV